MKPEMFFFTAARYFYPLQTYYVIPGIYPNNKKRNCKGYSRATQKHFIQSRAESALIADKCLSKKKGISPWVPDLEALPSFRVT